MNSKYLIVCSLLLVSINSQAGCVPGRNICSIFGEPAAREFDAQQRRLQYLQDQQTEAIERQNKLIEEQNEALKTANDVQVKEYAHQRQKASEEAKLARLKDGTADYSEDGNGVYCAMYGRCYSPALKEKWNRTHGQ